MIRHPLFREEDNAPQSAPLAQKSPAAHTEKPSPSNALWNRMHLAIRLSCGQSKPPIKR